MNKYRHSRTFWLSVVTVIGIFIVNTLGFTDTITGSAMGCGRNWPLCNGQVFPSVWNTATMIEYTHRVSVLVGGGLLLSLSLAALRKYGRVRSVRMLVVLSLLGVVMEGALGALSVLFVNPPVVMAAHMGVALISFIAVVLLTVVIGQVEHPRIVKSKPIVDTGKLRSFTRVALWSIPYGYMAIYVGAYVASTGCGEFFQGWPFPTESLRVAGTGLWIDILHRSVGLGYVFLMARLVWLAYLLRSSRPRYFLASCAAFTLILLQAVTGAWLIASHLSNNAFLVHVTNVSILFALQCCIGFSVLQERPKQKTGRLQTPHSKPTVRSARHV